MAGFGTGLGDPAADAAAAFKDIESAGGEAAGAIDDAFARAGESLARSLARAASDGKVSLKELAAAVIAVVDQAAGTPSSGGLGGVLDAVLKGAFAGARADGGPVTAGSSYLVGERGPEVFRPASAGTVEAAGAGPVVNVTLVVPGGTQALARSEAQVASALQRAARMGVR